jgi:hypothetical protein
MLHSHIQQLRLRLIGDCIVSSFDPLTRFRRQPPLKSNRRYFIGFAILMRHYILGLYHNIFAQYQAEALGS